MTPKNIYTNIANLSPLSDFRGEITPRSTAFAAVSGENVVFDTENIFKYPMNIHSLTAQPLNELARHVLGVIGSYEYVTIRMIIDVLNMMRIPADSRRVSTACERLRKTGLIYVFRFKNEDESNQSSCIVYTITKLCGESALRSLGISNCPIENYNVVMEPSLVKRKLATNQILFAHLKHNMVDSFEKSRRYAFVDSATEEHVVIRPSLAIQFKDKSNLFYEVVRKSPCWDTWIENKLSRYNALKNNWVASDETPEIPQLVICCEDEEHAKEVNEIARNIYPDVFYTHDLLFFGEALAKHLFTIDDNGNAVHFKISFDDSEHATVD
jgi:hypothetical protein